MTLKQAFTQWASLPLNTVLAAKSRDAVQRVLMKQYGDMRLEVFTERLCRGLFSMCKETLELQVKAAAILVYVLTWGSDHGHCQRPTFTYEIASEEWKKRQSQSEQPEAPEPEAEPTSNETIMKQNNPTAAAPAKDAAATKKTGGHAPRPVVQIDPETLQPVRQWPSIAGAAAEIGCLPANIHRALSLLRTAGGFYWTDPDDADTFKDRLAHKKATPHSVRALQSSINRGKRTKAEPAEQATSEKPESETPKPSFDKAQGTPAPAKATTTAETGTVNYTLTPGPISRFSDEELSRELKRRGWQGELTKTLSV